MTLEVSVKEEIICFGGQKFFFVVVIGTLRLSSKCTDCHKGEIVDL
jgi:hypothetical protein